MRRLGPAIIALAVSGGCGAGISDLANFIGDPFGEISDSVQDLNERELEALMAELMLRFRSYLALREAIPFEVISPPPEQCTSEVRDTGEVFSFVADVDCVFETDPAEGRIRVTQQLLASEPVEVFRFELDYERVVLGDLEVHGSERITETDASDGASVRRVELTQNGIELDYEFRAGLEGGETPVFDYQLPGPDGDVLARITNPSSAGGFVTVFLTGLDGTLACEVRDSLWTPERLPRGSCDNGLVFGLPD